MRASRRVALERPSDERNQSRILLGTHPNLARLIGTRRFDVLDVHCARTESAQRHQRSSQFQIGPCGRMCKKAAIAPTECHPLERFGERTHMRWRMLEAPGGIAAPGGAG